MPHPQSTVALNAAETQKAIERTALGKPSMPPSRVFVSGMLAGAFIAFGALFFCLVSSDTQLPFAASRVLGGVCFCLGLVLVVCCGAELFTGNIMMMGAVGTGKLTWGPILKNWVLVWFGNFAGALVAVALVFFADIAAMNGGAVGEAMVSIAAGKAVFDGPMLFFKGVLCNIFVCLAVRIGFSSRAIVDKVVGVLLPITAFVACGFEHCIANMFFLSMGLLQNAVGVGAAGAVGPAAAAFNLAVVTLGNIVGGGIVAVVYWFLLGTRSEEE
ncbi:MAG: formate/nitrite transporter family protein [Eggerthellaceae bacterium]|nr:formate/nitrite transporter family protein [Eggerthellaceae bacterium]